MNTENVSNISGNRLSANIPLQNVKLLECNILFQRGATLEPLSLRGMVQ